MLIYDGEATKESEGDGWEWRRVERNGREESGQNGGECKDQNTVPIFVVLAVIEILVGNLIHTPFYKLA